VLNSSMAYMRIANVDGEEPYGSTMKLIKIAGFRHGLTVPMSPMRPSVGAQATLRRSYCEHGDMSVFKGLDTTSGKIFDLCSRAAIITDISLLLCRSDTGSNPLNSGEYGPIPFLSIVMTQAVIANFTYEFKSGWPTEQLDIRYTSISWILDWVSPVNGAAANLGGVGWNGGTNVPTPPYTSSAMIPSTVNYNTNSF